MRGIRISPENFVIVPSAIPEAFQCEAKTGGSHGYTAIVRSTVTIIPTMIANLISFISSYGNLSGKKVAHIWQASGAGVPVMSGITILFYWGVILY